MTDSTKHAPRKGRGKDLPQEKISVFSQKYKQMIMIPKEKPSHQFLLCPVGNAGAGKTTVVEPLSKKLSLVRISGDEVRKLLQDNGFNYKMVRSIALPLIEEFVQKGYSVAIDSDCAGPATRKAIEDVEEKHNISSIWVHVNPPEQFIIDKLRNYDHTWLFENGEEAVKHYLSRKPMYENLDLPFVYTFDTSKDDLEDQIKEAEDIIREKTGN